MGDGLLVEFNSGRIRFADVTCNPISNCCERRVCPNDGNHDAGVCIEKHMDDWLKPALDYIPGWLDHQMRAEQRNFSGIFPRDFLDSSPPELSTRKGMHDMFRTLSRESRDLPQSALIRSSI
jgi:hypothetical protein